MIYQSPIGTLVLTSHDGHLIEICFQENDSDTGSFPDDVTLKAVKWLRDYFSEKEPDFLPPILLENMSEFRKDVLTEVLKIPYGKTKTYQEIAEAVRKKRNMKFMSAQAVGQAIRNNPICIIIPCHRVLGKGNTLIGYRYGLGRKAKLLELEHIPFDDSIFH